MSPEPPDQFTAETVWTIALVPFVIFVCAAVAGVMFLMWRSMRADREPDTGWALATSIGFAVLAGLIGLALWWGMYPWKAEYHEWRAHSGTVSKLDSRIVSAGDHGGSMDKYVVKFEGDDQLYGVLDTRMANVEVGDELVITCVRRWQWSGSHGYDCNYVDSEPW